MSDLLFVVVERTPVGDSVLGVFSSIERARALIPPFGNERFHAFRVECHVVDAAPEVPTSWQVVITRAGVVRDIEVAIGCFGADDDACLEDASYIERGGERLHVIVWAKTKGEAAVAAAEYRRWLLEQGVWGSEERKVEPIHA